MKVIYFSLNALIIILKEFFKSGRNLETGGILISPKSNQKIITDFIPSTIYAERKATTYYQSVKDVQFLNMKLRQFQNVKKDFAGYIHTHPFGLCNMSIGDIETCKEILLSPNYKINNYLIMCIVVECDGKLPLYSYSASLDKENNVLVEKLAIKVFPNSYIKDGVEIFSSIKGKGARENEAIVHRQRPRKIEV